MPDYFESLQFVLLELMDAALLHGDLHLLLRGVHSVQIRKQENRNEVYRLLPRDEEVLYDICFLDAWYPEYDTDLVYSVEYVLRNRNPVETDGAGRERTLTSDYLAAKSISGGISGAAKKTDPEAERNRDNYQALISMIPQEAIDRAVEHFKAYFWQWVDRFIAEGMPFMQADAECRQRIFVGWTELHNAGQLFTACLNHALAFCSTKLFVELHLRCQLLHLLLHI